MKNMTLVAMVAGFVVSVTLGSGVAQAQFGSWNPVRDVQREARKAIDTVAPVTAPTGGPATAPSLPIPVPTLPLPGIPAVSLPVPIPAPAIPIPGLPTLPGLPGIPGMPTGGPATAPSLPIPVPALPLPGVPSGEGTHGNPGTLVPDLGSLIPNLGDIPTPRDVLKFGKDLLELPGKFGKGGIL